MTHSWLLLLIDALAVFRLTRLTVEDSIFAPVRDRLIGRTYGHTRDMQGNRPPVAAHPKVAEFLSCPWCVSMWLAAIVVALQDLAPAACLLITAVLAFSAVAGLLSRLS